MSDIVDEAQEREEELRAKALAVRRPTGPVPCGFCYNCGEAVVLGHRWCDTDCAEDWKRLQDVERSKAGRYYDD
mgnify:FL=1